MPLSFCRSAPPPPPYGGGGAGQVHLSMDGPRRPPQGVRLPPCPARGACSSWVHKGRGRPSGPRPHTHKVAGGFCSFCLPPAGGQAAPLPPGLAGGSDVCPYAPAIHKGKVVPLQGLHLAFCLASHGPLNGSWLGAGPAAAATAGARHPRPLPHSASGSAGVPRYPPCRALVGSWPLS